MELLRVDMLTKEYSGFQLKDVSLSLPAGYIMGCVGRNGAGKTTTLNMITGMTCPKSGTITLDGLTYEKNPQAFLDCIGYIGDESYFPKELKIRDIERILKTFYQSFSVEKYQGYLEKWELPRNKKVSTLSKGMKVKLMFAGILSRETKLLILDEATNGLDPVMRREIMQILQSYVEDGEHSILFSTHMLNDLEQIADYILFIEDGQVILNENKDDLLETYSIVKGDTHDLTGDLRRPLIGVEENAVGFEALIEADSAIHYGKEFLLEKPSIDQIVLHHLKEREKNGQRSNAYGSY